jgi:hypothetical protein
MAELDAERAAKRWTDAEKAIFMERFLAHPKEFHKIASFLPGRTAGEEAG